MKKDALRVSTAIPVAPTTLYFAWLDGEQHTAMTGSPAKIEPVVGSNFTAGDGYISGKLVTLDLGRRIIMSWRTRDFPRDAHDSRAEVHFEGLGAGTRLTILHTEIPEGQGEQYRARWMDSYFTPMRTYFSKYLPDPREPPPPRRIPPPPPEDEEEETPKLKGKLKGKPEPIAAKGKPVAKTPEKATPAKPVAKTPEKATPAKPVAKTPEKAAPKPVAKTPEKAAPAKPVAKAPAKPAKPVKPAKPAPKAAATPAKKPAKPAKPTPKKAPAKKAPAKKPSKKR